MIGGVTLTTIRKHSCATFKNDRVICICGEDLNLSAQTALSGPTHKEITDKWSAHLAEKILSGLRRKKMLRDGL